MKKLTFVLILLLLLPLLTYNHSVGFEVKFYTGDDPFYDNVRDQFLNWQDFSGNVIPNAETALAIATSIYEAVDKHHEVEGLVPSSVFYDEDDEIWVVSFDRPNPSQNIDISGGGWCIAMRKSDGQVVKIWRTE